MVIFACIGLLLGTNRIDVDLTHPLPPSTKATKDPASFPLPFDCSESLSSLPIKWQMMLLTVYPRPRSPARLGRTIGGVGHPHSA